MNGNNTESPFLWALLLLCIAHGVWIVSRVDYPPDVALSSRVQNAKLAKIQTQTYLVGAVKLPRFRGHRTICV